MNNSRAPGCRGIWLIHKRLKYGFRKSLGKWINCFHLLLRDLNIIIHTSGNSFIILTNWSGLWKSLCSQFLQKIIFVWNLKMLHNQYNFSIYSKMWILIFELTAIGLSMMVNSCNRHQSQGITGYVLSEG